MSPRADEQVPRWLWRALVAGLLLTVVVLVGGAILLALGAADVPPLDELVWQRAADEDGCLPFEQIDLPPLAQPTTVELMADVLPGASEMTVWGLWLAAGSERLRWKVLPPGYYHHEGQTYPFHHVTGGDILRLDIAGDTYTLWLNRERAVTGQFSDVPDDWGLIGSDTVVCWQLASVYGLRADAK